jgi:hypothetical protein
MSKARTYADFLAAKAITAAPSGMIDPPPINEMLFPFQADIVRWALRRGKAAIFADCGLGKTPMQLEWAKHVHEHTGRSVVIVAPLAVAEQTIREGAKFHVHAEYVRDKAKIGAPGIYVTNYEMLDHFDPAEFSGVVLDESSILKAYDGSTRTAIIEAFRRTPFKLACTATPAPNDYMELGNHAEFLGTMTRAEMLAMFFTHDGGETQKWRLKGHAVGEFWRWVCSWAVNLRAPSDLGYPDDGFVLPELTLHHHVTECNHATAAKAGMLFAVEAQTLDERRQARKASTDDRVAKCAEMANASDEPWLIWCNLNAEGDALAKAIPDAVQVAGADSHEDKIDRALGFASGKYRVLVSKSSIFGFGMNWQHCPNVAFCGLSDSWEQYYQAVRRVWRFGQKRPVQCHVVTSELEGAVVSNIKRKEADATAMAREMVSNMAEISSADIRGTERTVSAYVPTVKMTIPGWLKSEGA